MVLLLPEARIDPRSRLKTGIVPEPFMRCKMTSESNGLRMDWRHCGAAVNEFVAHPVGIFNEECDEIGLITCFWKKIGVFYNQINCSAKKNKSSFN